MSIRFFFLSCVLGFSMLAAVPAQAGLLEFFFPSLAKKGPDPSQTLKAPFADSQDDGADQAEGDVAPKKVALPENAVPLDKQHRQVAQIGEYVGSMVAEAMSFEDDYEADMKKELVHFAKPGAAQYQAFLEEKNIMKVLQSGRYRVSSVLMDTPLMLNAGVVGGRYHWLFQVPVMVSYLDKTVVDYKGAEPINQKIVVKLQLGRYNEAPNDIGLLVESWSGTVRKLEEPE